MAHPLLERLAQGVVLTDGAMGTMLFDTGHTADECLEQLNVTRARDVSNIHRQYIAAGADIIESNTFGANRIRLSAHGLEDDVRDLNKRGVRLAREEREVSGEPVLVAGSIGPTGRTLVPIGLMSTTEAEATFTEQVSYLLEAGVDLLIIETMGNLDEMQAAITASRSVSDLPIVAMMTFGEDGRTLTGSPPEDVVRVLSDLRVDVIGANCSVGPQRMVQAIARMRDEIERAAPDTHRPYLAAMPNAGWPTTTGGRLVYSSSPEYFADFARKVIDAGARMVGGCCGTTPAHIAAMRLVMDEINGRTQPDKVAVVNVPDKKSPISSIMDLDESTELARDLGQKFLRCVEIDPPKGLNPQKALDGARLLKAAGVDAINVADSPMARVRMSAMTLCYLIQREVGVETIIHFTTRDRSLMGLQSELLGAHAAGVRNVLALTGDPPSLGHYANSSAVFDVDSIGLIRIIDRMNSGEDIAGESIGRPARFTIACAVDPTKSDLEDEARRLHAKLEAGAHLVMTQPIFDVEVWTKFLKVFGETSLPVPVMVGILPLQSSRHAEFLHNEVPGITLTDRARHRMREAGPNGRAEGVKMAQELLEDLVPLSQGVYLMPSFGRYEVAAEVLDILPSTV